MKRIKIVLGDLSSLGTFFQLHFSFSQWQEAGCEDIVIGLKGLSIPGSFFIYKDILKKAMIYLWYWDFRYSDFLEGFWLWWDGCGEHIFFGLFRYHHTHLPTLISEPAVPLWRQYRDCQMLNN